MASDKYDVSIYHSLHFSRVVKSAEFPAVDMKKIEWELLLGKDPVTGAPRLDQEKAIPYVCDFVAEYINSDYLVSQFTNSMSKDKSHIDHI